MDEHPGESGKGTEPKETKMIASEIADQRLDEIAKEAGHDMVYSTSGAATCQKCGNRAVARNLQCWLRSATGECCSRRLIQVDDDGNESLVEHKDLPKGEVVQEATAEAKELVSAKERT